MSVLTPRRPDAGGLRDYLAALRPRVVVVRVSAGKVRLALAFPLWALEEIAAFALGALELAEAAWPRLPARLRTRLGWLEGRGELGADGDAWAAVARTLDELAGGRARDILRLPPGVPFLSVTTDQAKVEVTQL